MLHTGESTREVREKDPQGFPRSRFGAQLQPFPSGKRYQSSCAGQHTIGTDGRIKLEYLRRPAHKAKVITLQSQLHKVIGRSTSGVRTRRPWALASLFFGVKTVRDAPKPARAAVPRKMGS